MALQNLSPSAPGDLDSGDWTLVAGASKWEAVKLPDDDATSYLEIARTSLNPYSAIVGDKPAGISAVNGLKVGVRFNTRDNAEATQIINPFARFSGVNGTVQSFSGGASAPAFASAGPSAVARPGGGSWTVADIYQATLQVGMEIDVWLVPDPGFIGVTTLWFELDYAPPIGGLVFGIIGSLGPIAAAGLLLDHMAPIALEVCRRTPYRLRIQPHEYEQALRELREHRYPVRWFRPALA